MRCVLLSDTHNLHRHIRPIPPGDLLIHAGDLTGNGTAEEVGRFLDWFAGMPHRHKLFIAGNHDFLFERDPAAARALVPPGITYLQDGGIAIDGLKIWGTPWQPTFFDWAFNLARGPEMAAKWALVPDDTDVLVTHGPPAGTLDLIPGDPPESVGCEDLAARLPRLTRLKLHVFGHIHEGYGRVSEGGRVFVNASNCDARYRPVNPPVVVDL